MLSGFSFALKKEVFLACCRPDHQVSPAAPKMILLTNNHRKRSSCVSRTPPNDSLYYQTFTFDLIHLSQSHLDSLQEPLDSIILSHLCAWSQEDANRLRGWEELRGVNTLCWLSWRKTCSVDPTRRSSRKHFISSQSNCCENSIARKMLQKTIQKLKLYISVVATCQIWAQKHLLRVQKRFWLTWFCHH